MARISTLLPALLLLSAPALAQDQPQQPTQQPATLGGPGESCRARSDCVAGLKCVNQSCRDEHEGETCGATADCGGNLKCVNNRCVGSGGAGGGGSAGAGADEWMKFKLDDGALHPFIGLMVAGGPVLAGIDLNGTFNTGNTEGALLLAIKAGFVAGPHELSVDVSPMTYFYSLAAGNPGPTFQFNVAYHYLIKLYEGGDSGVQVFYPIGVGAGLFTGNTGSDVFFQASADLIGFMIKIGHALIDITLPSFRYGVTSVTTTILGTPITANVDTFTWLFGATFGYAF